MSGPKLYSQDELDAIKAQEFLRGKMEGFLLGEAEPSTLERLKELTGVTAAGLDRFGGLLPSPEARGAAPIAADVLRELLRFL